LLYIQNQKLYFYDLYEQELSKEISLEKEAKFVFAFANKLMLIFEKEIRLYTIQ